jgi:glycosyltransferase involved in cell wall biosynthesis
MRVLVLVQGALGDRLTGPEIRGMEIARAFARRHVVTVAAPVAQDTTRDGLPVIAASRRRILAEARRHDVVLGPVLPPYVLAGIAAKPTLGVADLYDPVDLELGTLSAGLRGRRAVRQRLRMRRLQLRWADVVVCANDAQLRRARADLADLPDRRRRPELVTVPMGLPGAPPPGDGSPLRDRFPEIEPGDPLVLWWGSVWRWLDAGTVIRAIGRLARDLPRVRLVLTAGRPPNADTDKLNATEPARDLARRLGLLGRHVFFLDDWVPFDERHLFLRDADVGITLHADTAEATLAARARYMDYLWAGLPSVLARGDEVADRFSAAGAAELVAPRDVEGTALALHGLLSDPGRAATARAACGRLANAYSWPRLINPLVEAVEHASPRPTRRASTLAASTDAARYYLGRSVDRVVQLASR